MGSRRAPDPARLQAAAEAAAREGDWKRSLGLWRQVNAGPGATAATLVAESRACLVLGLAGQAEQALRDAVAKDPAEAEAYLPLLKIMRVEDRFVDALRVGWAGLEQVAAAARSDLLRELTLAALTDVPDDLARTTLKRWIEADPNDVDARAAYLRRIGAEPRSGDPDRETRLSELAALLASHPEHLGVRAALVTALADAGEVDRGRAVLNDWPADQRDSRYWRLRGRWDIEFDHAAEQAVTALRSALDDFPQDWRTHYRLARALKILGQAAEAGREAETVSRIRELLDPLYLEPKLESSFARLDQAAARETLAELCSRAGLGRLAEAWRSIDVSQAGDDHRPDQLLRTRTMR